MHSISRFCLFTKCTSLQHSSNENNFRKMHFFQTTLFLTVCVAISVGIGDIEINANTTIGVSKQNKENDVEKTKISTIHIRNVTAGNFRTIIGNGNSYTIRRIPIARGYEPLGESSNNYNGNTHDCWWKELTPLFQFEGYIVVIEARIDNNCV